MSWFSFSFFFFTGKERKYLPRMRKFHSVIPYSRLISFPVGRKKIYSIYAVVEKKKRNYSISPFKVADYTPCNLTTRACENISYVYADRIICNLAEVPLLRAANILDYLIFSSSIVTLFTVSQS